MEIWRIFCDGLRKFDWIIIVFAVFNGVIYWKVKKNTDKIYNHFNSSDKTSNLSEKALDNLRKNTGRRKKLSDNDLLDSREKMNKNYALYLSVTTMFPLLGMLGTVWALIPMVNTIGTTDISNFFSALTSTAWGIVIALIFKFCDSKVSYKIEDNEKHIEHLLFKE